MDIVSINQVNNLLVMVVLFLNSVLIFYSDKVIKNNLMIMFLVFLSSCIENSDESYTELFGIKIHDNINSYINIDAGQVSEKMPKNIFFLNTQKNPFNKLVKNKNLDTYQLKINKKNKILTITGLKNFNEISSKNFKNRCGAESNYFKIFLSNQYKERVDLFTLKYYKSSNAMGRDYLFFSNELRFNKDSKKLMIQIMCSYTNIDNYVHSTLYVSLVDQNYWSKNSLKTWKRRKKFNNILTELNLESL